MSWHAVDAVDDAIAATRRFLFPFSPVRWAKLALLVLLMGGGVTATTPIPIGSGAGATGIEGFAPAADSSIADSSIADGSIDGGGEIDAEGIGAGLAAVVPDGGLLAAIVVGAILVAVVFSVFSLSVRLAFYDALHTNDVRLWRPFVSRLRQATGLFAVLTAMSIAAVAPVSIAVLVAGGSAAQVGWTPLDSLLAVVTPLSSGLTVTLGIAGTVFALLSVLALRLTYEFVVPAMIVENRGVIAGWKRVWKLLRRNRADVAVYLVVHFLIGIGVSILETLVVALVGTAVVVTAGLVLLVIAGVLGGFGSLIGTTAGIAVVLAVVGAALLMLVLLLLPIRVVTRSYLISYEVSTLGGIDRSLTLLHPNIDPTAPTAESSEP